MLTVTLVATFAAAALWQQWRSVEVEIAERGRLQVAWLLIGSLDWARIILKIDGNTDADPRTKPEPSDHFNEPWATPLEESRLSTFLAADKNNTGGLTAEEQVDAFLSGSMVDAQSKLNVFNLIDENGNISKQDFLTFKKLYAHLNLPEDELESFVANLKATLASSSVITTALKPQRVRQLNWLGLSPQSLDKLTPYITLLPIRTTVNINTAPAEVILASVPKLNFAEAKSTVSSRSASNFTSIADAEKKVPALAGNLDISQHSVATQFFEVTGRIRLEEIVIETKSLIDRRNIRNVKTLWRERAVVAAPETNANSSIQP